MKRMVETLSLVGVLQEMWHDTPIKFYMKSGKIRVESDSIDELLDSELLDIYLIEGARRLRNRRRAE